MPLTPGSTFERYEIESLIGRGGMGEVYRAVDSRLHRPVALKVLRTDKDAEATVADAGGVQRLLREARAAAALNHANSVAIYELGEAEGIAYIAMELVTGVTLRKYLGPSSAQGSVSIETKVTWLVDAARALWAAHKAGLIHRDVKPGNIMVSEEGVVKVLDFGLAKEVTKKDPAAFQTLIGQVLGTPRYMAPEQLEGKPADAATDQFAFGLTAYELLSGAYPGGPLAGAPASLDTMVSGVSAALAQTVARMMARDPRDRFPTMESAAHSLRACTTSAPSIAAAAPVARTKSGQRTSEHPTVVQPSREPEPASVSREIPIHVEGVIEKSKTLPLGMPMQMAMGEAPRASGAPGPHMNKTMPMATQAPTGLLSSHPLASIPPAAASSGRLPQDRASLPQLSGSSGGMNPTSGVYASNAQAPVRMTAEQRSRAAVTAPVPRKRANSWVPLIFVAIAAAAAGGLAAWLLH